MYIYMVFEDVYNDEYNCYEKHMIDAFDTESEAINLCNSNDSYYYYGDCFGD